jgi:hypothetical protein
MQSENINELAKALAAAQAEIEDPHKTKTGKIKGESKSGNAYEYSYKYADIADVLKNVRACLSRHGIAVSQPTMIDGNALFIQTKLLHESGQWMASDYPVCNINGDHQKMGGALTYSRRYALCSMVGVAADDDADGQGAAAEPAPKTRRSAAQSKRDGGLDGLRADLADCNSAVSLEKLRKDYQYRVYPTWPKSWVDPAEMEFDARLAEFSSGEHLEQTLRDSAEIVNIKFRPEAHSKAEYVQACHDWIDTSKSTRERALWWTNERPSRTFYKLNQEEVDDLKARIVEKNNEPDDAPWGRDKGGNASTLLDAG